MFHRVLNVSLKSISYFNANLLNALQIELEWRVNILEQTLANVLFLLWLHKSGEEQVR